MKKLDIMVLLSFTAGFVDTASFLGLEGLFTAHVTGNFVTLGARWYTEPMVCWPSCWRFPNSSSWSPWPG
jgi:uncharacterized membrane protein YoaK (UPF0700 family)